MFNKQTLDVLTQINGITNSVILKYPTTVAVSESQDMMINVNLSEFDKDSFPDIGLKDSLSDFLSLLKMFGDEREVTFDENTINVKDENASSSYIMDSLALMSAYDKSPDQFSKTEEVPSVATFDLTVDDIKRLKSATGVFKDLSEIIFTSQDGDMKVSLGATNKFNAKSNTYSVTKSANTTKEFEVKIPVDNFKMLPQTEYQIEIKYNSARDSYRLLLISKTITDFKILMTVKV